MSLSKSQINGDETNMINYTCPRPPLKINKDSHAIQKSSSVVVEKNNSSIKNQNSCSKRQPVIIYTHPPKIIYAKACEFMDIVQKLTGLEKPTVAVDDHEKTIINHDVDDVIKSNINNGGPTDEKFVGDGSNYSSISQPMSNPYMVDNIPPVEFFSSSSMPNYVLQSSTNSSNMANSISPMYMDMMNNGFPDYY